MPINSRTKGKVGEREFVNYLKGLGYKAKRGQQFKGSPDSPDVECVGMPAPFHWEVKRTERANPYAFLKQAIADAGDDQTAIVAHRQNNKDWMVMLDADDFFAMLDHVCAVNYQDGLKDGRDSR